MSNTGTGSLTPQQIAAIENDLKGGGTGAPSIGGTSPVTASPSTPSAIFDETYGVNKALAQAKLVGMMPGQGGALEGMPTSTVGAALEWFNQVPASGGSEAVYAIQVALFRSGLLNKIVEPGIIDTATETAFKDLLQHSAAGQVDPQAYLNMAETQGQYGLVDQALRSWITSLQGDIAKTKSEHFTITDSADVTNSFIKSYETVLGIAPTQDQVNQFVHEYQNQQRAKESDVYNAERQQYRVDLNYAQSALKNTGIDGVGDFVQAYKDVMGKNASAIGAASVTQPPTNAKNAAGQEALPHGMAMAGRNIGGVYNISLQAWQQAQQAMPAIASYRTPASAPPQVQEAVLNTLAANLYHEYGDWGDVASMLVEGVPVSGNEAGQNKKLPVNGATGPGAPRVSAFVSQILAAINQNMQKAQQFITQGAPTVSTTVTQPSLGAEGVQYAQQADPLRADATAIVGNYGDLIGRMFRPGGLVDAVSFDPTTGAGMTGIGAPTAAQAAAATGGQG